jgi:hypothetical protein
MSVNDIFGELIKEVAVKVSLYQALNEGIQFTERNFERISDLSVKLVNRIVLIFIFFMIYAIIQNSINQFAIIRQCQ